MEIMLIAVVSPLIRCEWQLHDWQVALVTTVSDLCSPMQVIHHKGSVCGTTRLHNIHFPIDQINSKASSQGQATTLKFQEATCHEHTSMPRSVEPK